MMVTSTEYAKVLPR